MGKITGIGEKLKTLLNIFLATNNIELKIAACTVATSCCISEFQVHKWTSWVVQRYKIMIRNGGGRHVDFLHKHQ